MKSAEEIYSLPSSNQLILSQKASRFWLPYDLKRLEVLSPLEYLSSYCRVSLRRHTLYKQIFDKYKSLDGKLHEEVLVDALSDVYTDLIGSPLIDKLILFFGLSSEKKIDFVEFRGMAAFSERYFFNVFKRSTDCASRLQKEIVEILDFSSLKWKLIGVDISPQLDEILRFI